MLKQKKVIYGKLNCNTPAPFCQRLQVPTLIKSCFFYKDECRKFIRLLCIKNLSVCCVSQLNDAILLQHDWCHLRPHLREVLGGGRKGDQKPQNRVKKKVKNRKTASKFAKIPKPQVQMCKMTSYHLKLCIR